MKKRIFSNKAMELENQSKNSDVVEGATTITDSQDEGNQTGSEKPKSKRSYQNGMPNRKNKQGHYNDGYEGDISPIEEKGQNGGGQNREVKHYSVEDYKRMIKEIEEKISNVKEKKVERPSEEASNKKIKTLNKEIERLQDELKKVKKASEDKVNEISSFDAEKEKLYEILNPYKQELKVVHNYKEAIEEDFKRYEQEKEMIKESRDKMAKELGKYRTKEAIDMKIESLENTISSGLDRFKENKLIGAITKLKRNKDLIDEYKVMEAKFEAIESQFKTKLNELQQAKEKIKLVYKDRQIYYDQLNEIQEKKKKLIEEKNVFEKQKQKIKSKISSLYKDVDKEKSLVHKGNEIYHDQISRLKRLESALDRRKEQLRKAEDYQKRQSEREAKKKQKERDIERKRQQKEKIEQLKAEEQKKWLEYEKIKQRNPYEKEIDMCQSVLKYLKEIKPSKKKGKKAQSINHAVEKFNAIVMLGLSPPINFDAVPETILKVEQKLKHYKSYQKFDENERLLDEDTSSYAPINPEEKEELTKFINKEEDIAQVEPPPPQSNTDDSAKKDDSIQNDD